MFPNLNSACPPQSPVVSQMWSPNSFPIAFHLFPSCLPDYLSQLWSSIIYLNSQLYPLALILKPSLLLLVCKAGLWTVHPRCWTHLNTNLPKLHLGKKGCLMMFDIHIVMNMWRSYCWSNLISAQMMSRTSGWSCSCFTRLMAGRKRQPQSTPWCGATLVTRCTGAWPVLLTVMLSSILLRVSPWKIFLHFIRRHICLPFFSNNAESGC